MSSEKEKNDLLIPLPKKRSTDSDLKHYNCMQNCRLCLILFVLLLGINMFSFYMIFPRIKLVLDYGNRTQEVFCDDSQVIILFVEDTSIDSRELTKQITEKLRQIIHKENDFESEKQATEEKVPHLHSAVADTDYDKQNGHNHKTSLEFYKVLKNLNNIKIEPAIDESKYDDTKVSGKLFNEGYDNIPNETQQKVVHFDSAAEDNVPVTEAGEEIDYNLGTTLPGNEDDDYEMNEEAESNEFLPDRFHNIFKIMPGMISENGVHYGIVNERDENVQNILYNPQGHNGYFMPLEGNINDQDGFRSNFMNEIKDGYYDKGLNEKTDDNFDDKKKDVVLRSKVEDDVKMEN